MVPTANEVDVAKLIRRRLMGEAAKSMEELNFDSISELISTLKQTSVRINRIRP